MSKQLIIIHGADAWPSETEHLHYLQNTPVSKETFQYTPRWKQKLAQELANDFDVLSPTMPCRSNANFAAWGIWFDRMLPFIEDEAIFVGHSMGGIFLVKYLSENNFPKTIKATILVAAPFDDENTDEPLCSFALTKPLDNFSKQAGKVYLMHSEDDPVVPYEQVKKYQQALPQAKLINFTDRDHFSQIDFPELRQLITTL
jgi:hypothetical protein